MSDDRDPNTGRWLLQNRGAEQHGAVTLERRGTDVVLTPELRSALEEFRAGVLSDLGGDDNLTMLERGLVDRICEIQAICCHLAADVARRGVLTPRGRQRSSVGTLYAGIDRYQRLSAQLGLKRRAKEITDTIQDYLKRKGQPPQLKDL